MSVKAHDSKPKECILSFSSSYGSTGISRYSLCGVKNIYLLVLKYRRTTLIEHFNGIPQSNTHITLKYGF